MAKRCGGGAPGGVEVDDLAGTVAARATELRALTAKGARAQKKRALTALLEALQAAGASRRRSAVPAAERSVQSWFRQASLGARPPFPRRCLADCSCPQALLYAAPTCDAAYVRRSRGAARTCTAAYGTLRLKGLYCLWGYRVIRPGWHVFCWAAVASWLLSLRLVL